MHHHGGRQVLLGLAAIADTLARRASRRPTALDQDQGRERDYGERGSRGERRSVGGVLDDSGDGERAGEDTGLLDAR